MIRSAIKYRAETGEIRNDFLQFMLETRNGHLKTNSIGGENNLAQESNIIEDPMKQKNAILSDDDIISQSILFILAGFDTTQSLLLFAIYELAICPHVQEKLATEVQTARKTFGGTFTYESINRLEYLDKVVNGMRLDIVLTTTVYIYKGLQKNQ